ncbi:MAG: hypothetical protein C0592_03050 [Marinilabiliales bacterium]|nr:MAG: hypothetical protein C0592_03050 [Marinilabiliales bacterium]
MTVEEFFNLFLEELKDSKVLRTYYRFLDDPQKFEWRKAYYCQRLQYIIDHIDKDSKNIWDCGCGYGTTAIFLALNGYKVSGTTLEFYFDEIEKHVDFWSKHGDISSFTYSYENVLEAKFPEKSFDTILIQDTLHHLEPLQDVLSVLRKTLSDNGEIVLIEENGHNIIQNLKLIKQRGFKKIKEIYDERLGKTYLMGDENIRSLRRWRSEFGKAGFVVNDDSVEYVRFYLPRKFNRLGYEKALEREAKMAKKKNLRREYFFFGLNFTVRKVVK